MSNVTASDVLTKSIHEAISYVEVQTALWLRGDDVAVPYIVGVPGIAKTALMYEMCKKNDWNLFHTHYGLTPHEEVSGMPDFKDLTITVEGEEQTFPGTMWRLPDILTKLYKIAENGKPTIWFMDDYHLSSSALMHLSYEMFTQESEIVDNIRRRIPAKLRGYSLPANVAFVLAGNTSAKAGAKAAFSAVTNRVSKYNVHLDFQKWKQDYAIPNGVNLKVVSFLTNINYQSLFIGEEDVEPWPSPRSWSRLGFMLNVLEYNRSPNIDEILYLSAAHVGSKAASDFAAYYAVYSKIDVESIFDAKVPIQIPSSMLDRYVYMIVATMELVQRVSQKNKFQAAVKTYCEILAQMSEVSSEIAVVGLKEITLIESSLKLKKLFHTVMSVIRSDYPKNIQQQLIEDVKLI